MACVVAENSYASRPASAVAQVACKRDRIQRHSSIAAPPPADARVRLRRAANHQQIVATGTTTGNLPQHHKILGRLNMFFGSGRGICWGRRSWSNVGSGPIFCAATVTEDTGWVLWGRHVPDWIAARWFSLGLKSEPRVSIANLIAFHSLLHQWR